MGLEVLQKSDDPLELFEGVFQMALGLQKTFAGVVQSSDIELSLSDQETGVDRTDVPDITVDANVVGDHPLARTSFEAVSIQALKRTWKKRLPS